MLRLPQLTQQPRLLLQQMSLLLPPLRMPLPRQLLLRPMLPRRLLLHPLSNKRILMTGKGRFGDPFCFAESTLLRHFAYCDARSFG
jgi:hypothetical protein